MLPENSPKGLTDARMIVASFPFKFVVDFTGNQFCEDLLSIWVYNFHTHGFNAALDALDAAKAKYDIYPVGNRLQKWLTARWLERQLAA